MDKPQNLKDVLDTSWVEDPTQPGVYRKVTLTEALKATVKK